MARREDVDALLNFFDFDGTLYGAFGIIGENIDLLKIDPKLSRDAKTTEVYS